jgi:hypothetical protein
MVLDREFQLLTYQTFMLQPLYAMPKDTATDA